ncbi:MAG TPA: hypothetical protein VFM99_10510 [Chitinophagales bacterium]|nr:hypothetical protein [Chitinophagales bacterium]
MKKILLSLIVIASSAVAFAQSNSEDVDMIQAAFGKEKKELMSQYIKLDADKKDAFWNLYDEYETQRKELGKKRIALINNYAANYTTMDDAKTTELIKEMSKMSNEYEKLMSSYFTKLEKAVGAKQAAQFYQMESYLLSVIRVEIMNNIPFIGELDY